MGYDAVYGQESNIPGGEDKQFGADFYRALDIVDYGHAIG